jgi:hypothetical protein
MRKFGLALLTTAALAGVAGCGSSDNAAKPPQPKQTDIATLVSQVSQQTSTRSSAKFTTTLRSDKGPAGTGHGVFSLGGADGGKADVTTSTQLGGAKKLDFRVISIGKTLYVQLPAQLKNATGQTKPWSKITPGGNDLLSGLVQGSGTTGDSADPRRALDMLKAAGKVRSAKPEQLDGKQTTHYTIDVDTKKAMSERTKNLNPQAKKQLTQVLGQLPPTTATQLWVGQDNLPVRLTADTVAPTIGKVTTQVDYTDWGTPVNVTAPPADQVGAAPKLPSTPPR